MSVFVVGGCWQLRYAWWGACGLHAGCTGGMHGGCMLCMQRRRPNLPDATLNATPNQGLHAGCTLMHGACMGLHGAARDCTADAARMQPAVDASKVRLCFKRHPRRASRPLSSCASLREW